MKVVFFDIDGTLIDANGAGSSAMRAALANQFGVPEPTELDTAGRTDRGIAVGMFEEHGIEHTEAHWERFRADYLDGLSRRLPKSGGRVLPGVAELVAALPEMGEIALGLLTGNVRDGARRKLEFFGLAEHFPFGGFGDEHLTRDLVARDALAEAGARLQRRLNGEQSWVIGDTPLDIFCARAIGARVAAVATGLFTADQLREHRPDLLLDDLSDTARLLDMLGR